MKRSFGRRRFLTIAAVSAALGGLARGAAWAEALRELPLRRWQGSALGAEAEILLYHQDAAAADRAVLASLAEIARLERIFSLYRADSSLAALNRQGELRNPPLDLVLLLQEARRFGAITGGAFDVTVQPLWRLYESHFQAPDADPDGPRNEDIEAVRCLVDYRDLIVEPERIALRRPGMAVTLNGIAQGYITDRVAELLESNGLRHVLVHLDETRALGPRADGAPWRVGIEDPGRPSRAIKTVELSDGSIGTSGGYGTQFDAAGRFNHIFDPATGRCAGRYRSVSVMSPLAATADGLSTAFSVIAPEAIRLVLRNLEGVTVILVTKDNAIVTLTADYYGLLPRL